MSRDLDATLLRLRTRLARHETRADALRAQIAAVKIEMQKAARNELAASTSSDSSSDDSPGRATKRPKSSDPTVGEEGSPEVGVLALVNAPDPPAPETSAASTGPCEASSVAVKATRRGRPKGEAPCRACLYRELGKAGGPRHTYAEGCRKV